MPAWLRVLVEVLLAVLLVLKSSPLDDREKK